MKKLFEISSEEKQRILEMHETATKKNYLSEQSNRNTIPVPPSDIQTKIGGGFDFRDVLSKWMTQSQGTSGTYYWFSTHDTPEKSAMATLSVISLFSFSPTGTLERRFDLKWGGPNDRKWYLTPAQGRGTYPPGWSPTATLESVILQVPNTDYSVFSSDGPIKLDQDTYRIFVTNYVRLKPESTIAKAFKSPVVVDTRNEVNKSEVDAILKSQLYNSLKNA